MKISKLIAQLTKIKAKHGDLLIGSGDSSPDEGLCYELQDVLVTNANNGKKCVDLTCDGSALNDEVECGDDDDEE